MKFFDRKDAEVCTKKVAREVVDTEISENIYSAIREVKAILETKIRTECRLTSNDEIKWEPYLGTKHTENMDNLGYVIGLRCGHYSFRVDYDPIKGIHINYGSNDRNENFIRARKALRPENVFSANGNDENYVRQVWEEMSRRYRYFDGSLQYEKCHSEVKQKMENLHLVRIF